ncbi:MAG: hypothetical protein IJD16_04340 [Desulfovibrio sp.]|nr:hypothetical protein [Desulfovibrio sp.]
MREQKSPTLAGMGRQKGVICVQGERIPTAPVRQEICADCSYLRAKRNGQELWTFCLFTGESVRPSTPACEFWPGIAYADAVLDSPPVPCAKALTRAGACGMVETPNQTRRNKCLSAAPQREKILSANSAVVEMSAISGGQLPHIGRVQRPQVREAAAASDEPGSVVALPFLRSTANQQENLP